MKVNFYFLILWLFSITISAQDSELYYEGYFLNKRDKPQNLLKITNKNNGNYEYTDKRGYAIIQAKPFDTLVWNNGANIIVIPTYNLKELKTILESQISKTTVNNVQSEDYQNLIKAKPNEKADGNYDLSTNEIYIAEKSNVNTYSNQIKLVKSATDSSYFIKKQKKLILAFNGNFTSLVEASFQNGLPKLQNQFVQGFSENGNLVWTSPLQSNYFSYGPEISTLGFDGIANQFDINGNLVPIQNAKNPSRIYDNTIIKPLFKFSNFLNINGAYKEDNEEIFGLKLKFGQAKEPLYFIDQFSRENQFAGTISSEIVNTKIKLQYQYNENKATNTNRIGLFNRIYQNALSTPISFENKQNEFLNNGNQRSFNAAFDNPYFLLETKDKFNFKSFTNRWNLILERELFDDFKLFVSGNTENSDFVHHDFYQPSTAFFLNGIENFRTQKNENKAAEIGVTYSINDSGFRHVFSGKYLMNDVSTFINHTLPQKDDRYQRTSNEYIFNYKPRIDLDGIEINLELSNNFYASNSSTKNRFWLPKVYGSFLINNIFGRYDSSELTFFGGFSKNTEEAGIQKSYSYYELSQMQPENSFSFFPTTEVETYQNLKNIDKTEWRAGFSLKPTYRLFFSAEYFNRRIEHDVFPEFVNGNLMLRNMANHTLEGVEAKLEASRLRISYDFYITNSVNFYAFRDLVNKVESGYNHQPIIGFASVYNGLVEGEALGSIVGTSYLRNSNGEIIIDSDGFPVKDQTLKVIANPTPDFSIKLNNSIEWKNLRLDMDWEWQKGGKIWNGTQAALDYYGRSYNSGLLRNTNNYVFDGVDSSGNPNTIAVDFYNPNYGVTANRWSRYGIAGITEEYIQDADYIKLNTIALTYNIKVHHYRDLKLTASVSNIFIWRKYDGVDAAQNFYNSDGGKGLDFFNLPGFTRYGLGVSFDF